MTTSQPLCLRIDILSMQGHAPGQPKSEKVSYRVIAYKIYDCFCCKGKNKE